MTFANGKVKEGVFIDNVFNGEAEEEDAKKIFKEKPLPFLKILLRWLKISMREKLSLNI